MASKFAVNTLVLATSLITIQATAQVLPVAKVTDPSARVLQRQNMPVLEQIGTEARRLHFAYPFYFSQALDIDEPRQKLLTQGSIHFDNFNGQTVLAITGNYYISYSAAAMNHNQRARRTYEDVVLPLLKIEVAHLDRSVACEAFAFEIAHHVRGTAMKVRTEGPENLTIVIPRAVAERLVKATDLDSRQGALLESEVFLNGEPLTLWLSGEDAPADVRDHYLARHQRHKAKPQDETSQTSQTYEPGTLVSAKLIPQSELAAKIREGGNVHRDVSPVELQKLQTRYATEIQKLTTDLSGLAHFVDYAPPTFISFRDGAYLQLSVNTELEQLAGSSQYRLAALAFDSHVSHLLRPVAKSFHGDPQFQGVNFSTTIHGPGQSTPESVEFVVPFTALVCYERYDCTGQELINRSVVLINGERAELKLMQAEADPQTKP
jgi:hypothetical protein